MFVGQRGAKAPAPAGAKCSWLNEFQKLNKLSYMSHLSLEPGRLCNPFNFLNLFKLFSRIIPPRWGWGL